VKLTEAGLKRFRRMAVHHEQWIVELLGGLSQDDQQTMLGMLQKLKEHCSAPAVTTAKRRLTPIDRKS